MEVIKLNILMVLPSFQEEAPFFVATEIGKGLVDKGFKVYFLSLRKASKKQKENLKKDKIVAFDVEMGKFPTLNSFLSIKKIIKKNSLDVVHAHCFWPTVICAMIKHPQIKIVTVHQISSELYKVNYGFIVGKIMEKIENLALLSFSSIICISNAVLSKIQISLKNRCKTINNGIPDVASPVNSKKDNTQILLASTGRLSAEKNHIVAIRAAHYAIQRGVNLKYCIFGEGEEKKNLKAEILKLGLQSKVYLKGKLKREDLIKKIRNVDIFMFPSLTEGLGLSAIEAQMLGIPVIASNIPALREVIKNGENGYTCNPTDHITMGKLILFLNKNRSKLRLLSKKSRLNFKKKYGKDLMVNKYILEYEKAAKLYSDINKKD